MGQTMKCHSVQKTFSAYQDGEIKGREGEEIRAHVLSCKPCREEYGGLGRLWQIMGDLEEVHPDPWFYGQVVAKIRESGKERLLPVLEKVFQLLRGPAIASVLVTVGIVVGVYLGNVMVQSDFLPFRQAPGGYSQESFLDSLRIFDSAPPGTLAHGYMRMAGYKGDESK